MTIDLEKNETTIISASKNATCNIQLKSLNGKNIVSTIHNFKNDQNVVVIRKKDYKIKTFLFENEIELTNYDFGDWTNSKEIYNSKN